MHPKVCSDALNCNEIFKDASIALMNREMAIRRKMTPEVLDDDRESSLFNSAVENGCGARFTGAGGGGCIWALGPKLKILTN